MLARLSKSSMINYTAIGLLERFGNLSPTQEQIDDAEMLITILTELLARQRNDIPNLLTQNSYVTQMIMSTMEGGI